MKCLIIVVGAFSLQLASTQILSGPQRNIVAAPAIANLGNDHNAGNNLANLQNINAGNIRAMNLQAANVLGNTPLAGLNNVANIQSLNYASLQRNNLGQYAVASPISPNNVNFNTIANRAAVPYNALQNPNFGLQIVAEALEIGGNLAVKGKLPFQSTMALGGRLPTDGSVTVNYACGGLN